MCRVRSRRSLWPCPVVRRSEVAKIYERPDGENYFLVEPPLAGGTLSLNVLRLMRGVEVPAHVHATETEALYGLSGGGTMTVGGVAVAVTEDSVIQIPPGVEHSFSTPGTSALQFYSPAGPEQRFKKPPAKLRPSPKRPL